jgi:hypothetical protein
MQAFIHLKICFMKAKFPILIAAALLVTAVSKAQYGRVYADAQFGVQGQVVFPGSAVISYNYNNQPRERYDERREWNDDRREWRGEEYERFCREHRDWREDEYQRYCHEHREFRGDRPDYYRDHYSYRVAPYCAPRRVVVYGY